MFYLAYPAYHALLHTKHATSSTTEGTPYRVPSGQDPWVWPDNPAYPPWPHLRYPLTSKDEDPNNKKLLGRVAHERRGYYCFICSTTVPRRKPIQLPERAQRWYITSPPKKMLSTIYLCLAQSVVTPTQIPILLLSRPLHPTAPAKKKPSALCAMLVMNPYHTPKTRNRS